MRIWRMVNVVFLAFSLCRIGYADDTNGSDSPRARLSPLAGDSWNFGTQRRKTCCAIPSGSTSIVGHLEPILLGFYPIAGWGLTIGQVHVLVSPTLWPLCSLLFSCHLQRLHARGSTMSDSRGGCNGLRGFGRWGKDPGDQVQEAEAQTRLKQGPHDNLHAAAVSFRLWKKTCLADMCYQRCQSPKRLLRQIWQVAKKIANHFVAGPHVWWTNWACICSSQRETGLSKNVVMQLDACLIGIHATVGNRICLTWNFLLIAVLPVSFTCCSHMKLWDSHSYDNFHIQNRQWSIDLKNLISALEAHIVSRVARGDPIFLCLGWLQQVTEGWGKVTSQIAEG